MAMTTVRSFATNDAMPVFGVSIKRSKGFGSSAVPVSDDANLALAKAIGARMVRKDFFWADGEPGAPGTPGQYDMSTLLSFLQKNAAAGMKAPVVILNKGNNRYTGDYGIPPTTDAAIDAFAAFAAKCVEVTQAAGFTPYWALFNEANSPQMWGGPPDPVAYGKLVTKATLAMKAVRPTCSVITGGMAVGGQGFMEPGQFLAAMLPYIDPVLIAPTTPPLNRIRAFGSHPYNGGDQFMYNPTHWPENYMARMEGWRPPGLSHMLMYNDEQGVATPECAGVTWAEKEERQAVFVSRIRLSMLMGYGFGILYNLINDGWDQTFNEHQFGQYDFNHVLKPSGRALTALNDIINPSVSATLQRDGNSYQGTFTHATGQKKSILWAADGTTIISPQSNPIIISAP